MKKSYIYVYISAVFIVFAWIIAIFIYDIHHNTRQYYSETDISEWTDYTITGHTDSTYRMEGYLDTSHAPGHILAFYSVHANVEVYADDVLVYQYPLKNSNPLSKSPGYAWNLIPLEQQNTKLNLIFQKAYPDYAMQIPTFYVATPFALFTHLISSNLVSIILCSIIFFIGVCMIVFWFFVRCKVKIQSNLLKLGIFAILLSIWSMNECRLFVLILKNNIVCSYISFLVLMLLPFALASFVCSFYESHDKIWNTYFKINLVQIILCLLLQLFKLIDLRDTLWTSHVMMLFLAVVIFYCSFNQLRNGNQSRRIILNILCTLLCVVTLIMDLVAFYLGAWGNNSFGRIGFLCYVLLLGLASAQESANLMKKGQEATTYQTLAYTDQMTGLYNRAAFNRDFDTCNSAPEDIALIDFDLNNLKKANDNYGHQAGDKYITDAAHMIQEIFTNIGKCYRIGGDEFAVILNHSSTIDIRHYLTMLEWSVDAYNRKQNVPFRMQIAFGVAVFSSSTDQTLENTFTRADAAMYSDKKTKKGISR